MKKMKKIMAAAIAMMTFSTAAAVTGTVAWFTASNVVTASGMSIKADTESGLVIANENFSVPSGANSEWNDYAIATHDGTISGEQAAFIPTSTIDATAWYHANASEQDNYVASDAGYQVLTLGDAGEGIAKVTNNISVKDKYVYLLNKFYLKASTPSPVEADHLYVNSLKVDGSAGSTDLDHALRVLVAGTVSSIDKTDPEHPVTSSVSFVKIFAPLETTTVTHTVGGVAAQTYKPVAATATGVVNEVLADNVVIPASTTANESTLCLNVYFYFEGEDPDCKSSKITASLDTLALTIKFGTETL